MNRNKAEAEEEARQERVLEQLKLSGRVPVPPPGHFHHTGEKQRRKKDRKQERTRLRDLVRSRSKGMGDD